jgi:exopolysaccharide production protein ExoZ
MKTDHDKVKANQALGSIQGLRALAASLVVFYHAQMLAQTYSQRFGIGAPLVNSTPGLREFGAVGVDIFFVISGFIMTYVCWNQFEGGWGAVKRFFKKRFFRIVPLYWFYTSILVGLLIFLPHLFQRSQFDLARVVNSYFLIPSWTPPGTPVQVGTHVLEVGWTLTYEFYFYLCVAISLFFSRKAFPWIVLGIFVLGVSLRPTISEWHPIFRVMSSELLFEFIAGVWIGIAYRKRFRIARSWILVSIVSSLLLYGYWILVPDAHDIRSVYWGLPSALFVLGVLYFFDPPGGPSRSVPAWMLFLGDSSYTLYLSHYLFIPAFGKIWMASGVGGFFSLDGMVVSVFFTAILLGCFLYRMIEVPLLQRTLSWSQENERT